MVAAAERRGYHAYAITDHARNGDPGYRDVVTAVRDEVERLAPQTPVHLFAGVEVTDFEPARIPQVAEEVRRAGAEVVVVHGECLVLDVATGTNAAAVRSPGVDILAHPGLLSEEDAEVAERHGIYVEISARHGADYANGHVYRVARRVGAPIIVNSDAHEEAGLLSHAKVAALVRGAGAPRSYLIKVQDEIATSLVNRLVRRRQRVTVRT
jgi:histidinol phosphatase-like PHP family hydrolase